jgi:hypothetical protein
MVTKSPVEHLYSFEEIPLGERLRQIRFRIVASDKHFLDEDEIEKELASRRGELQGREGFK